MDDGTPTLEVGFAIDTGGSFESLAQLQQVMDSAEAKIVREAANIERATGKMLNVGSGVANITAFGNAVTREAQNAARELGRVEKSGESMSRQLDRQISTFGKTKEEIRAMRVETAALAAEQKGLTELAGRLRTQEAELFAAEFAAARKSRMEAEAAAEAKAMAAAQAEREAAALASAAAAAQRDAREHTALAAAVRASHDAQLADAAAAERMREATDPLYAATKRLNAEIAESTRLYHQGATAPAEYARQQEVLAARLRTTTEQNNLMAVAGGKNAFAMRMMALQTPDIVQGLLTGQKPMTVFIQQGGQLAQIAMMAEGGLKGMARQLAVVAAMAAPVLLVVGAAAGGAYAAFHKFQDQVKDDGELTRYRDSLGLTRKEMEQLSDGVEKVGGKIKSLGSVTITFGDEMAGIWKTIGDRANASGTWNSIKSGAGAAFEWILEAWGKVSAGITAGIRGTFNAVQVIWGAFPSTIGNVFVSAANLAISAMNALVRAAVAQINGFIAGVNTVLPAWMKMGSVDAPQIDLLKGFDGAKNVGKRLKDGYVNAYTAARKEDAEFWKQAGDNAKQHAKDRMSAEADAIKANRTAPKPKVDHNALNAEATEAQIKNLYALAAAYGQSGGAALIAEARVKAESKAIKAQGDIAAEFDRQLRLSIAQHVSDGAKETLAMREQTKAQQDVNAMVAAGLVPAQRAADLVKDRIADLPLLAALEAAAAIKDQAAQVAAIKSVTAALEDQRKAREAARSAAVTDQFNQATSAGNDRLAELREELRLVGETDAVRVHSLATIRATQDAVAIGFKGDQARDYVTQQVRIADETERVAEATRNWNDALGFVADKWDLIAQNVQSAAQGLGDAFGNVGKGIGDLATIYAGFQATRARLDHQHDEEIRKAGKDQAALERANAKFAVQSSTLQVAAFGDMASAAKGFFKEGTSGYAALQKAEQVFRAIQFAMSVRRIAQDAAETASAVVNGAIRTAKLAVEGVAAQAKLPFPLNIAAMAATAGALAAIGVAVAGAFGGGGSAPAPSNQGTGTVLGDHDAKSDSIKNAIESLKQVDTVTNTYAREMSASLKSIDNQIGGVAAVLVRSGADINANDGVKFGFDNSDGKAIGTAAGLVFGPIGALLGRLIGGLFGTRTDVVGSGIFGAPQSVGSIVGGGFNAQYFSDLQKTHKFLGIVSGRSYETQYAAADPALAAQFTLVLRSFSDAIKAAAVPLGESTATIEQRLNNFVVDIGKVDLQGLTGAEIQEKLTAIFGAAADKMATGAFPSIAQFQKVGEGAFETLVRVASTVEQVSTSLDLLGTSAQAMGIAAKLGLADQFDSVSALTSAADAYFQSYYSQEEQAAARAAQLAKVFGSLGVQMPATLTAFRALVEAQDLTTASGQATYATLLQLAPAFADLKGSLEGVKSAADVAAERLDLQRQLLELQGNTAAIRALDLAKLDESNRALQVQIWAIQDAQEAAKAADELRQAWVSVGDSIQTEIARIRGLSDTTGSTSFASLLGQFNATNLAAQGGDQNAAKSLPQLSQALLAAAADTATSRQELARVQAQTAASLEATFSIIGQFGTAASTLSNAALLTSAGTAQAATSPTAVNDDMATEIRALRDEVTQLRSENNAGHAATAGNTGAIKNTLTNVTANSGGNAISVEAA